MENLSLPSLQTIMPETKFTKKHYLKWYEDMLLMRKFEERAGQLYGMQKIKGFCHLYIGQEAVVAGAMSVLFPEDNMITAPATTASCPMYK